MTAKPKLASLGRIILIALIALAMIAALVLPAVAAEAQTNTPTADETPATAIATNEIVPMSGATTELDVKGRGWGHGIGMGQYGAYGYATRYSWDYRQILGHFYGGTTIGNRANSEMTVRLVAHDNSYTSLYLQEGQMVITTLAGDPIDAGAGQAIRFRRIAPDTFAVWDAPTCAGPWTQRDGVEIKTSTIKVNPSIPNGTNAQSLAVCSGTSTMRWYRGEIRAVADPQGIQRTVNALPLESYLRGVVPRESPASWGNVAGGINALKSQAVAARTYAVAENRYAYARTCDTDACQVYSGRYFRQNGSDSSMEYANTDRAIAETAGEILVRGSSPVYAMYSSSTGGHTVFSSSAGFPPVPDLGDVVSPRHTWTTKVTKAALEAKYGRGELQSVEITQRNGLGEDGGRVLNVRLTFANGVVNRTGNEFRRDFNLFSDWFTVSAYSNPTGPPVTPPVSESLKELWSADCIAPGQGDIQRLYTAFFLRLPETNGWNHWVAAKAGGQSLSSIAGYFAGSAEFVGNYGNLTNAQYVDMLYRNVFGRAAESGSGPAYWRNLLDTKAQGRGSVMLNFSNSAEYRSYTGNCS